MAQILGGSALRRRDTFAFHARAATGREAVESATSAHIRQAGEGCATGFMVKHYSHPG